ncbi:translation initiation factor IF-2-like [Rissa tridactyla]|uniref:translation initiation factor IF-2-like n=1 Tax=Rissa tridactyla TaxID=75485 RepID=UPI0023BA4938|nr:translation initiation factor IF-2-like [Rissa tridactyla]
MVSTAKTRPRPPSAGIGAVRRSAAPPTPRIDQRSLLRKAYAPPGTSHRRPRLAPSGGDTAPAAPPGPTGSSRLSPGAPRQSPGLPDNGSNGCLRAQPQDGGREGGPRQSDPARGRVVGTSPPAFKIHRCARPLVGPARGVTSRPPRSSGPRAWPRPPPGGTGGPSPPPAEPTAEAAATLSWGSFSGVVAAVSGHGSGQRRLLGPVVSPPARPSPRGVRSPAPPQLL